MKPKFKKYERVVFLPSSHPAWSKDEGKLQSFSKINQRYFVIIDVKNENCGFIYYLKDEKMISSEIFAVNEEHLTTLSWANEFFNIKETIDYSSFEGEIIHFD